MKARLWVINLFVVATIVSWPYSANAVTISFKESENSVNGMEVFPVLPPGMGQTTVTTDLGMCAGGAAPPCVLMQANGKETASVNVSVPAGTFLDPDVTRVPLGPPPAADSHLARAFLQQSSIPNADISDRVELKFISGGGAPAPDQINLTFTSDLPEDNLNFVDHTRVTFINDFIAADTGGDVVLNNKFFTGPVTDLFLQRGYCQNPPCGPRANLPTGYTITAQSDVETAPEPSPLPLLAIGVIGLAFYKWRVAHKLRSGPIVSWRRGTRSLAVEPNPRAQHVEITEDELVVHLRDGPEG